MVKNTKNAIRAVFTDRKTTLAAVSVEVKNNHFSIKKKKSPEFS